MARAQRGLRCAPEDEVRIALLAVLTDVHGWRGEWAEGGVYAEQVIALARPGTQPWAAAVATRSVDAMMRGQLDGAVTATLLQVCDVEPAPRDLPGMAFGMMAVAYTFELACRFELADRIHGRMDELIGGAADPVSQAWHGVAQCLRAYLTGAPARGLHAARAVQDRFRIAGVRRGEIVAQCLIGTHLWLLGQLADAEPMLRATLSSSGELGPLSSHTTVWLAQLCKDRGELAEARRIAEGCIEHGVRRGFVMDEGLGRWALADVLLQLGDLDAAEEQARRAALLLAPIPADELLARATLAAVLLAQGRAAEALSTATQVLARYDAVAALAHKASFARLVHAEALAAVGDRPAARRAIAAARRELVARSERIMDPELRHGFLHQVPEHARILELDLRWDADRSP
jgi:tetratricopeptide (TPR) repeat protein